MTNINTTESTFSTFVPTMQQLELNYALFVDMMDRAERSKTGAYALIKNMLDTTTGRSFIGLKATQHYNEGVDGTPSSKNPKLMRLFTAVHTVSKAYKLGQAKDENGKKRYVLKGCEEEITNPNPRGRRAKAMKVAEADQGVLSVNLADRLNKDDASMAQVEAVLAKIAREAGYQLKPGCLTKILPSKNTK